MGFACKQHGKFCENVCLKFPVEAFLISGNHEQYGKDKWLELTGRPRQFAVYYGEYVFLMCDTYSGNLDPTENSDGTYEGIELNFLKYSLKRYKDKKIIICAHYFDEKLESKTIKKLI